MYIFNFIILFLLGSAAGSFINVLSLRYKEGNKIFSRDIFFGRSLCPHCGKILSWYELIPFISFIIQRGHCRSCGFSLSWQYPIVEFLGGLILTALPLRFYEYFGISRLAMVNQPLIWYYLILVVWILAAYGLLLMSAIDFRLGVIPDQINLFLVLLGGVLISGDSQFSFFRKYSILFGFQNNALLNHLLAAGLGLSFFGLVILLSRGRGMGVGDLKLAGALGLLMGWPDAIFAFLFSFLIGAIWSLGLIIAKKKSLKSAVPFGPFMAIGVLVAIFFGEKILDGYFSLINFFIR